MTDIAHLLDNLFADLGGDDASSLPTFPLHFPQLKIFNLLTTLKFPTVPTFSTLKQSNRK